MVHPKKNQLKFLNFDFLIKSCAILVIISFILPHVAWTFEGSNYALIGSNQIRATHLGKSLTIPNKLGKIEAYVHGQNKTVICVQDLHCNYEVQKNIAAIIAHLNKQHQLRLVGEEGAVGNVDTKLLQSFPLRNIREQVSDFFVKQGKLTGAEYSVINSKHDIILEGIENQELYNNSLNLVKQFLNAQTQGLVFDLRDSLDELKTKLYNSNLKNFDKLSSQYVHGELNLITYTKHLQAFSKELKIDLAAYPHFQSYSTKISLLPSTTIDQDQLEIELNAIDRLLRQSLYTNQAQIHLDNYLHLVTIIEKLLSISVTKEELAFFRNNRRQFKMQNFINFIDQYETSHYLDANLFQLEDKLKLVETFYRLADERSEVFVDNLISSMETHQEQVALMVHGGFHGHEIMTKLREQNINTVMIKPNVSKLDIINPYFNLLQGQQLPIEKLLEKNQTILAMKSWLQTKSMATTVELAIDPKILPILSKLSPSDLQETREWQDEHNHAVAKEVSYDQYDYRHQGYLIAKVRMQNSHTTYPVIVSTQGTFSSDDQWAIQSAGGALASNNVAVFPVDNWQAIKKTLDRPSEQTVAAWQPFFSLLRSLFRGEYQALFKKADHLWQKGLITLAAIVLETSFVMIPALVITSVIIISPLLGLAAVMINIILVLLAIVWIFYAANLLGDKRHQFGITKLIPEGRLTQIWERLGIKQGFVIQGLIGTIVLLLVSQSPMNLPEAFSLSSTALLGFSGMTALIAASMTHAIQFAYRWITGQVVPMGGELPRFSNLYAGEDYTKRVDAIIKQWPNMSLATWGYLATYYQLSAEEISSSKVIDGNKKILQLRPDLTTGVASAGQTLELSDTVKQLITPIVQAVVDQQGNHAIIPKIMVMYNPETRTIERMAIQAAGQRDELFVELPETLTHVDFLKGSIEAALIQTSISGEPAPKLYSDLLWPVVDIKKNEFEEKMLGHPLLSHVLRELNLNGQYYVQFLSLDKGPWMLAPLNSPVVKQELDIVNAELSGATRLRFFLKSTFQKLSEPGLFAKLIELLFQINQMSAGANSSTLYQVISHIDESHPQLTNWVSAKQPGLETVPQYRAMMQDYFIHVGYGLFNHYQALVQGKSLDELSTPWGAPITAKDIRLFNSLKLIPHQVATKLLKKIPDDQQPRLGGRSDRLRRWTMRLISSWSWLRLLLSHPWLRSFHINSNETLDEWYDRNLIIIELIWSILLAGFLTPLLEPSLLFLSTESILNTLISGWIVALGTFVLLHIDKNTPWQNIGYAFGLAALGGAILIVTFLSYSELIRWMALGASFIGFVAGHQKLNQYLMEFERNQLFSVIFNQVQTSQDDVPSIYTILDTNETFNQLLQNQPILYGRLLNIMTRYFGIDEENQVMLEAEYTKLRSALLAFVMMSKYQAAAQAALNREQSKTEDDGQPKGAHLWVIEAIYKKAKSNQADANKAIFSLLFCHRFIEARLAGKSYQDIYPSILGMQTRISHQVATINQDLEKAYHVLKNSSYHLFQEAKESLQSFEFSQNDVVEQSTRAEILLWRLVALRDDKRSKRELLTEEAWQSLISWKELETARDERRHVASYFEVYLQLMEEFMIIHPDRIQADSPLIANKLCEAILYSEQKQADQRETTQHSFQRTIELLSHPLMQSLVTQLERMAEGESDQIASDVASIARRVVQAIAVARETPIYSHSGKVLGKTTTRPTTRGELKITNLSEGSDNVLLMADTDDAQDGSLKWFHIKSFLEGLSVPIIQDQKITLTSQDNIIENYHQMMVNLLGINLDDYHQMMAELLELDLDNYHLIMKNLLKKNLDEYHRIMADLLMVNLDDYHQKMANLLELELDYYHRMMVKLVEKKSYHFIMENLLKIGLNDQLVIHYDQQRQTYQVVVMNKVKQEQGALKGEIRFEILANPYAAENNEISYFILPIMDHPIEVNEVNLPKPLFDGQFLMAFSPVANGSVEGKFQVYWSVDYKDNLVWQLIEEKDELNTLISYINNQKPLTSPGGRSATIQFGTLRLVSALPWLLRILSQPWFGSFRIRADENLAIWYNRNLVRIESFWSLAGGAILMILATALAIITGTLAPLESFFQLILNTSSLSVLLQAQLFFWSLVAFPIMHLDGLLKKVKWGRAFLNWLGIKDQATTPWQNAMIAAFIAVVTGLLWITLLPYLPQFLSVSLLVVSVLGFNSLHKIINRYLSPIISTLYTRVTELPDWIVLTAAGILPASILMFSGHELIETLVITGFMTSGPVASLALVLIALAASSNHDNWLPYFGAFSVATKKVTLGKASDSLDSTFATMADSQDTASTRSGDGKSTTTAVELTATEQQVWDYFVKLYKIPDEASKRALSEAVQGLELDLEDSLLEALTPRIFPKLETLITIMAQIRNLQQNAAIRDQNDILNSSLRDIIESGFVLYRKKAEDDAFDMIQLFDSLQQFVKLLAPAMGWLSVLLFSNMIYSYRDELENSWNLESPVSVQLTHALMAFEKFIHVNRDPIVQHIAFQVISHEIQDARRVWSPQEIPQFRAEIEKVFSLYYRKPNDFLKTILLNEPGIQEVRITSITPRAENPAFYMLDSLLLNVPALHFNRPSSFPEPIDSLSLPIPQTETLTTLSVQASKGIEVPSFKYAMGRSLYFKYEDGDWLVVKLQKGNENPALLARELKIFDYWQQDVDPQVRQRAPIPVTEFPFKFNILNCQEDDSIKEALQQESKASWDRTGKRMLWRLNGLATAFLVPRSSNYNSYPDHAHLDQQSDPEQALVNALLNAATRHGLNAGQDGIVQMAMGDMYHNLTQGRQYVIWSGAGEALGRINNWLGAVAFVNLDRDGYSRDGKFIQHINDILATHAENPMAYGRELSFIMESNADQGANFWMVEILGRYALILTLLYGRWHHEEDWQNMDWENPEHVKKGATVMREMFKRLCVNFLEGESPDILETSLELVNWERLARQMAFWMNPKAYAPYCDPNISDQVKGKTFWENENLRDIYGDEVRVRFNPYEEGSWDNGFIGHPEEGKQGAGPSIGAFRGILPITEFGTAVANVIGLTVAYKAVHQNDSPQGKSSLIKGMHRKLGLSEDFINQYLEKRETAWSLAGGAILMILATALAIITGTLVPLESFFQLIINTSSLSALLQAQLFFWSLVAFPIMHLDGLLKKVKWGRAFLNWLGIKDQATTPWQNAMTAAFIAVVTGLLWITLLPYLPTYLSAFLLPISLLGFYEIHKFANRILNNITNQINNDKTSPISKIAYMYTFFVPAAWGQSNYSGSSSLLEMLANWPFVILIMVFILITRDRFASIINKVFSGTKTTNKTKIADNQDKIIEVKESELTREVPLTDEEAIAEVKKYQATGEQARKIKARKKVLVDKSTTKNSGKYRGLIPVLRNWFVKKQKVNEWRYDHIYGPFMEEIIFTGVPLFFYPNGWMLPFVIFRLVFIFLHLIPESAQASQKNQFWYEYFDKSTLIPEIISIIIGVVFSFGLPEFFINLIGQSYSVTGLLVISATVIHSISNVVLPEEIAIKTTLSSVERGRELVPTTKRDTTPSAPANKFWNVADFSKILDGRKILAKDDQQRFARQVYMDADSKNQLVAGISTCTPDVISWLYPFLEQKKVKITDNEEHKSNISELMTAMEEFFLSLFPKDTAEVMDILRSLNPDQASSEQDFAIGNIAKFSSLDQSEVTKVILDFIKNKDVQNWLVLILLLDKLPDYKQAVEQAVHDFEDELSAILVLRSLLLNGPTGNERKAEDFKTSPRVFEQAAVQLGRIGSIRAMDALNFVRLAPDKLLMDFRPVREASDKIRLSANSKTREVKRSLERVKHSKLLDSSIRNQEITVTYDLLNEMYNTVLAYNHPLQWDGLMREVEILINEKRLDRGTGAGVLLATCLWAAYQNDDLGDYVRDYYYNIDFVNTFASQKSNVLAANEFAQYAAFKIGYEYAAHGSNDEINKMISNKAFKQFVDGKQPYILEEFSKTLVAGEQAASEYLLGLSDQIDKLERLLDLLLPFTFPDYPYDEGDGNIYFNQYSKIKSDLEKYTNYTAQFINSDPTPRMIMIESIHTYQKIVADLEKLVNQTNGHNEMSSKITKILPHAIMPLYNEFSTTWGLTISLTRWLNNYFPKIIGGKVGNEQELLEVAAEKVASWFEPLLVLGLPIFVAWFSSTILGFDMGVISRVVLSVLSLLGFVGLHWQGVVVLDPESMEEDRGPPKLKFIKFEGWLGENGRWTYWWKLFIVGTWFHLPFYFLFSTLGASLLFTLPPVITITAWIAAILWAVGQHWYYNRYLLLALNRLIHRLKQSFKWFKVDWFPVAVAGKEKQKKSINIPQIIAHQPFLSAERVHKVLQQPDLKNSIIDGGNVRKREVLQAIISIAPNQDAFVDLQLEKIVRSLLEMLKAWYAPIQFKLAAYQALKAIRSDLDGSLAESVDEMLIRNDYFETITVSTYPERTKAIRHFISTHPGIKALLGSSEPVVMKDIGIGGPFPYGSSEYVSFFKREFPQSNINVIASDILIPDTVVYQKEEGFAYFDQQNQMMALFDNSGQGMHGLESRKYFNRLLEYFQTGQLLDSSIQIYHQPHQHYANYFGFALEKASYGAGTEAQLVTCMSVDYMNAGQIATIVETIGKNISDQGYLLIGHSIGDSTKTSTDVYFDLYQKQGDRMVYESTQQYIRSTFRQKKLENGPTLLYEDHFPFLGSEWEGEGWWMEDEQLPEPQIVAPPEKQVLAKKKPLMVREQMLRKLRRDFNKLAFYIRTNNEHLLELTETSNDIARTLCELAYGEDKYGYGPYGGYWWDLLRNGLSDLSLFHAYNNPVYLELTDKGLYWQLEEEVQRRDWDFGPINDTLKEADAPVVLYSHRTKKGTTTYSLFHPESSKLIIRQVEGKNSGLTIMLHKDASKEIREIFLEITDGKESLEITAEEVNSFDPSFEDVKEDDRKTSPSSTTWGLTISLTLWFNNHMPIIIGGKVSEEKLLQVTAENVAPWFEPLLVLGIPILVAWLSGSVIGFEMGVIGRAVLSVLSLLGFVALHWQGVYVLDPESMEAGRGPPKLKFIKFEGWLGENGRWTYWWKLFIVGTWFHLPFYFLFSTLGASLLFTLSPVVTITAWAVAIGWAVVSHWGYNRYIAIFITRLLSVLNQRFGWFERTKLPVAEAGSVTTDLEKSVQGKDSEGVLHVHSFPDPIYPENHDWEKYNSYDKGRQKLIVNTHLAMHGNRLDLFFQKILPDIVNRKLTNQERFLHLYSFACTTGEEAVTLAALLFNSFKNHPEWGEISDWDIVIEGWDRDGNQIAEARQRLEGKSPYLLRPKLWKGANRKYEEMYPLVENVLKENPNWLREHIRFYTRDVLNELSVRNIDKPDAIFLNTTFPGLFFKKEEWTKVAGLYNKFAGNAFLFGIGQAKRGPFYYSEQAINKIYFWREKLSDTSKAFSAFNILNYYIILPDWFESSLTLTIEEEGVSQRRLEIKGLSSVLRALSLKFGINEKYYDKYLEEHETIWSLAGGSVLMLVAAAFALMTGTVTPLESFFQSILNTTSGSVILQAQLVFWSLFAFPIMHLDGLLKKVKWGSAFLNWLGINDQATTPWQNALTAAFIATITGLLGIIIVPYLPAVIMALLLPLSLFGFYAVHQISNRYLPTLITNLQPIIFRLEFIGSALLVGFLGSKISWEGLVIHSFPQVLIAAMTVLFILFMIYPQFRPVFEKGLEKMAAKQELEKSLQFMTMANPDRSQGTASAIMTKKINQITEVTRAWKNTGWFTESPDLIQAAKKFIRGEYGDKIFLRILLKHLVVTKDQYLFTRGDNGQQSELSKMDWNQFVKNSLLIIKFLNNYDLFIGPTDISTELNEVDRYWVAAALNEPRLNNQKLKNILPQAIKNRLFPEKKKADQGPHSSDLRIPRHIPMPITASLWISMGIDTGQLATMTATQEELERSGANNREARFALLRELTFKNEKLQGNKSELWSEKIRRRVAELPWLDIITKVEIIFKYLRDRDIVISKSADQENDISNQAFTSKWLADVILLDVPADDYPEVLDRYFILRNIFTTYSTNELLVLARIAIPTNQWSPLGHYLKTKKLTRQEILDAASYVEKKISSNDPIAVQEWVDEYISTSASIKGPAYYNAAHSYLDAWKAIGAQEITSEQEVVEIIVELMQSPARMRHELPKVLKSIKFKLGDRTIEEVRFIFNKLDRSMIATRYSNWEAFEKRSRIIFTYLNNHYPNIVIQNKRINKSPSTQLYFSSPTLATLFRHKLNEPKDILILLNRFAAIASRFEINERDSKNIADLTITTDEMEQILPELSQLEDKDQFISCLLRYNDLSNVGDPKQAIREIMQPHLIASGKGASYRWFELHKFIRKRLFNQTDRYHFSNFEKQAYWLENTYIWTFISTSLIMATLLFAGDWSTIFQQLISLEPVNEAKLISLVSWAGLFLGAHFNKQTAQANQQAAVTIFLLIALTHAAPLVMVIPLSYVIHWVINYNSHKLTQKNHRQVQFYLSALVIAYLASQLPWALVTMTILPQFSVVMIVTVLISSFIDYNNIPLLSRFINNQPMRGLLGEVDFRSTIMSMTNQKTQNGQVQLPEKARQVITVINAWKETGWLKDSTTLNAFAVKFVKNKITSKAFLKYLLAEFSQFDKEKKIREYLFSSHNRYAQQSKLLALGWDQFARNSLILLEFLKAHKLTVVRNVEFNPIEQVNSELVFKALVHHELTEQVMLSMIPNGNGNTKSRGGLDSANRTRTTELTKKKLEKKSESKMSVGSTKPIGDTVVARWRELLDIRIENENIFWAGPADKNDILIKNKQAERRKLIRNIKFKGKLIWGPADLKRIVGNLSWAVFINKITVVLIYLADNQLMLERSSRIVDAQAPHPITPQWLADVLLLELEPRDYPEVLDRYFILRAAFQNISSETLLNLAQLDIPIDHLTRASDVLAKEGVVATDIKPVLHEMKKRLDEGLQFSEQLVGEVLDDIVLEVTDEYRQMVYIFVEAWAAHNIIVEDKDDIIVAVSNMLHDPINTRKQLPIVLSKIKFASDKTPFFTEPSKLLIAQKFSNWNDFYDRCLILLKFLSNYKPPIKMEKMKSSKQDTKIFHAYPAWVRTWLVADVRTDELSDVLDRFIIMRLNFSFRLEQLISLSQIDIQVEELIKILPIIRREARGHDRFYVDDILRDYHHQPDKSKPIETVNAVIEQKIKIDKRMAESNAKASSARVGLGASWLWYKFHKWLMGYDDTYTLKVFSKRAHLIENNNIWTLISIGLLAWTALTTGDWQAFVQQLFSFEMINDVKLLSLVGWLGFFLMAHFNGQTPYENQIAALKIFGLLLIAHLLPLPFIAMVPLSYWIHKNINQRADSSLQHQLEIDFRVYLDKYQSGTNESPYDTIIGKTFENFGDQFKYINNLQPQLAPFLSVSEHATLAMPRWAWNALFNENRIGQLLIKYWLMIALWYLSLKINLGITKSPLVVHHQAVQAISQHEKTSILEQSFSKIANVLAGQQKFSELSMKEQMAAQAYRHIKINPKKRTRRLFMLSLWKLIRAQQDVDLIQELRFISSLSQKMGGFKYHGIMINQEKLYLPKDLLSHKHILGAIEDRLQSLGINYEDLPKVPLPINLFRLPENAS